MQQIESKQLTIDDKLLTANRERLSKHKRRFSFRQIIGIQAFVAGLIIVGMLATWVFNRDFYEFLSGFLRGLL